MSFGFMREPRTSAAKTERGLESLPLIGRPSDRGPGVVAGNSRLSTAVLECGGKQGRATPLSVAGAVSAKGEKAASHLVSAAAVQNVHLPAGGAAGGDARAPAHLSQGRAWAGLSVLALSLGVLAARSHADERSFTLAGESVRLQDVSADVEVRYQAMRFNRAAGVWNVEVFFSNKGNRALQGPFVFYVTGFSNTTGPQQADGAQEGQPFFDLSVQVADGTLSPGETSLPRTLTLGRTTGSPTLQAKIYGRAPPVEFLATALTRSLNHVGQPLPGVEVTENGPSGERTYQSDPNFALITLGQGNGSHTWKFSKPGHLPVWRRETLMENNIALVPSPRLTPRDAKGVNLTLIGGGQLVDASQRIRIAFAPGAVNQTTEATLTALTSQTLPALLPVGWSPLAAFWLELATEPAQPASAQLTPLAPLSTSESAALVRWNPAAFLWDVIEVVNGNGASPVTVAVSGSGAFALVVGDTQPSAPPTPQVGQPLQASSAVLPSAGDLRATGRVNPPTSPASTQPEIVTATAEVTITSQSGTLPSGLPLRGEVSEVYQMNDGTRRITPRYESFITAYQRPSYAPGPTLGASFPLRPLFLLGGDDLKEATIKVDVLAPTAFTGEVFETTGGQIVGEGVRILAGEADFARRQAVVLRVLGPASFDGLPVGNHPIVHAFELGVSEVAAGRRVTAQFGAQQANGSFVLARIVANSGLYGVEPIERFASDAAGNLTSIEPVADERLPGITGAGQFLLLRVTAPQGLVSGIARDSKGQPAAGLAVRLAPWLTFSAADGRYRLLAPAGSSDVTVTDLTTGDAGRTSAQVTDMQIPTPADLSATPTGPRVVSVSPENGAKNVPRVAPITITFSEPINPGTIVAGGIQLLDKDSKPVPASLTLNLKNTIATLLPTTQLAPSTLHTILLSPNLADAGGLKLEGPASFTFTSTGDVLDRPAGAQLVLYEPGAANCPCAGGVPGYAVGDRSLVCVEGTPGTADPEVAVILVNEDTGETATVLSKPDGSFTNFIRASEDDNIAATFLNANGTRVSVAAGQQRFDDGKVGLFAQGGTVEAQGEGGAFQLIIPGGTIKNKAILRLEPMTLQEVLGSLPNPPTDAEVIAGLKISVKDPDLAGPADVSIPIDPARIKLAEGLPPEEGAYALAMVRELEEGGVAYQIVDKLAYKDGRLTSNTAPHKGFGEAFTDAIANNPIGVLGLLFNPVESIVSAAFTVLVLGNRPVTVTGRVGLCPAPPDQGCIDEQLDPIFQALAALPGPVGQAFDIAAQGSEQLGQITRRPLPGAFVSLALPQTKSGRPGRLQAGIAYATSDQRGIYALVLPFSNGGYILNATHPRFSDNQSTPLRPFVDYQLGQGAVRKNFAFNVPIPAQAAPRVDVTHAPPFPPTNQVANLVVDVIHPSSATITLLVDRVEPAGGGNSVGDVTISNQVDSNPAPNQKRKTAKIECQKELTAVIKVSVSLTGPDGGTSVKFHRIPFGLVPPATVNLPIQSDPEDKAGPQIERTEPLEGGGLHPGRPIVLLFSEPIDANVTTQGSQFALNDPSAGEPSLALSPDQTRLEVRFGALKAGQAYELKVTATIKDIGGNALVLPPSVTGNFTLNFRTLPVNTSPLPGVGQGGGVAVHGNFA
jgi:hypothetical protein